jgi:hypothetical protein
LKQTNSKFKKINPQVFTIQDSLRIVQKAMKMKKTQTLKIIKSMLKVDKLEKSNLKLSLSMIKMISFKQQIYPKVILLGKYLLIFQETKRNKSIKILRKTNINL